jgi:hypothetical protein
VQTSAKGVDFVVERCARVRVCAAEKHVAENMGGTTGSEGVVTGAGSSIDSDGGCGGESLLGGDADAVGQGRDLCRKL